MGPGPSGPGPKNEVGALAPLGPGPKNEVGALAPLGPGPRMNLKICFQGISEFNCFAIILNLNGRLPHHFKFLFIFKGCPF